MPNFPVAPNAASTFPASPDTPNSAYDPIIGSAVRNIQNFYGGYTGPSSLTNVVSQSYPDELANTTLTATAGTVFASLFTLAAGTIITNISVINASTTTSTPTHQWAGLATFATTSKVLVVSSDQTTTAISADTVQTFVLTAPYTIPTSGLYYVFFCIAGTTGPTVAAATSLGSHGRGNVAPFNSGPCATGQTSVLTVGSTFTQPTAAAALPLFYLN